MQEVFEDDQDGAQRQYPMKVYTLVTDPGCHSQGQGSS